MRAEAMSALEKHEFVTAVDHVKNTVKFDPHQKLTDCEKALLLASDHIVAIERRNANLAAERLRLDAILENVLKHMRSLRQGFKVAREGTRVGELTALASCLVDLQRALGLEPDTLDIPEETHHDRARTAQDEARIVVRDGRRIGAGLREGSGAVVPVTDGRRREDHGEGTSAQRRPLHRPGHPGRPGDRATAMTRQQLERIMLAGVVLWVLLAIVIWGTLRGIIYVLTAL